MTRRDNRLLVFLLLFLLLPNFVWAKPSLPKPSYDFYVYDQLGLMDQDLKNYIIDINKDIYNKTGAQVVVALTDDTGGDDSRLYATRLYREWGIGSKEANNGVLMLVVINDFERSVTLETGYGLEGRFTDSIQKRIIEEDILPSFRQDKYNEGILKGFNQLVDGIREEYDLDLEGFVEEDQGVSYWMILIIIVVIIIDIKFFGGMLLYSLSRSTRSGYGGSSRGSSGGGGRSGGGGASGNW